MAIHTDEIANEAGTGPVELIGQSAAKVSGVYNAVAQSTDDVVNISSVTDIGTGNFDFNFTNNFNAADYTPVSACRDANVATMGISERNTGYCRTLTRDSSPTAQDQDVHALTCHGTLA